jgi:YidC/Oxa1 family membrane protein insertase
MDRNQVTGIVLITLLMIVYMFFVNTQEDKVINKTVGDTIVFKSPTIASIGGDSVIAAATPDSTMKKEYVDKYGVFAFAAKGEAKELTLENNNVKISLNTKGGIVSKALLKKYKTDQQKPLYVVDDTSSHLNLIATVNSAKANHGKVDFTNLYFTSSESQKGDTSIAEFRLNVSPEKYIVQTYSLAPESYVVKYSIQFFGMDNDIQNLPVEFLWKQRLPKNEEDILQARTRSTINYYTTSGDFDDLSEASVSEEKEMVDKPLKWIDMKQKFFSSAIIAQNSFEKGSLRSWVDPSHPASVKDLEADLLIPIGDLKTGRGNFEYYFGPNHYQTMKKVTEGFDKNVYLGFPVINWVNKFVVIPTFNFLQRYIHNYGIIIIILGILVKLILLPLSYKSQISMAKMKVMKPELDEIKAKYGDDMQKVQAEQMTLYREVGINPLSGCIPVLLSMPVLLAMFSFFPHSIELRQQSFLWAHDLSTYDAPIRLPFTIPYYGSHVSIFTLLMTLSTLAYTYFNNQMSSQVQGPMKVVSYIMPVVFMFVLNSFPAGLSFYYFVSNLLSIGQQVVIRKFVDEDKIRHTLDENKKKHISGGAGTGKKSKWMQRVEDAMKQRDEGKKK